MDDPESMITGPAFLTLSVAALFFDGTRWLGITALGILALIMLALFSWVLISDQSDKRKLEAELIVRQTLLKGALSKADNQISKHLDTLANQRDVLRRVDRYGILDDQAWRKEMQRFIEKVIRSSLTDQESKALASKDADNFFDKVDRSEIEGESSAPFDDRSLLEDIIEERVSQHCNTRPAPDRVRDGMTPLEFEGACAAVLRSLGWDASTTQGSGDQGADVIATKNGRRLVIQCKLYTGVVGNKSIQEVIAAKVFYRADLAAVVCNSGYTRSATTLASASGVRALTYPELRAWTTGLEAVGAVTDW